MGSKIGNKKGGVFLCRLWRNVGNGSLAPLILNLSTRWRWVVSFTARSPYSQRKLTRYPQNRKLVVAQGRSELTGVKKNFSGSFYKNQQRLSVSLTVSSSAETVRLSIFISSDCPSDFIFISSDCPSDCIFISSDCPSDCIFISSDCPSLWLYLQLLIEFWRFKSFVINSL